MIIEQNIFHLKFGKAKDAIEIWKQIMEEMQKDQRIPVKARLLTDLTGPAYTLIVELNIRSYTDMNPMTYIWQINPTVHDLYQQFVPLCESAHREWYKIEAERD